MGGIRQLANELQLSIGTVSRALNDRPDVNPETRARVKAAAARAGYVPNQSGRSLRSGRTGMVAAVIPTRAPSADSGLLTVLEGARRTLHGHALDLIVMFRGPGEDPLESLQRIVQRRIADSVIISETTVQDPRLAYLQEAGVEYVAFGRSAGIADYPFVDFDVETMAAEAARIFVGDGHRKFGIVTSDELMNYEALILASFVDEVVRLGLPREAVRTVTTDHGHLGRADLARFAAGDGPTALLATHERLAASLYVDFAGIGLAVGRDVSVVCTFPAVDTRGIVPPLSHFQADLDAVGVALARHLIARLPDSEETPPASTLVPLRFAPRASHGPNLGAAAIRYQSVTQAPFRDDDRTQASTKATPVTPSSIVG
jgi:DNA-binding LacI/PurR family transcriptional regulator